MLNQGEINPTQSYLLVNPYLRWYPCPTMEERRLSYGLLGPGAIFHMEVCTILDCFVLCSVYNFVFSSTSSSSLFLKEKEGTFSFSWQLIFSPPYCSLFLSYTHYLFLTFFLSLKHSTMISFSLFGRSLTLFPISLFQLTLILDFLLPSSISPSHFRLLFHFYCSSTPIFNFKTPQIGSRTHVWSCPFSNSKTLAFVINF